MRSLGENLNIILNKIFYLSSIILSLGQNPTEQELQTMVIFNNYK